MTFISQLVAQLSELDKHDLTVFVIKHRFNASILILIQNSIYQFICTRNFIIECAELQIGFHYHGDKGRVVRSHVALSLYPSLAHTEVEIMMLILCLHKHVRQSKPILKPQNQLLRHD